MGKNYLLEIGVEELPARHIDDALKELELNTVNMLKEERINYKEVKPYTTPRRLTLIIEGLDEKQSDLKENIKGPAKRIAFDEEERPTRALQGFMKGQGVDISSIYTEEFNGEEYVFTNILKKGKTLEEVINIHMPNIIKSIHFPKSMKWGGKNLRFSRPIRWLVSMLNNDIVPFDLEGIPVSNITKGHRFLGSDSIKIDHVNNYIGLLRKNYVIVDQKERKEIIKYGAEKLAKEKGGNLQIDEELLNEVTNLVEYPTPLIGRIKEEYLKLPEDIVITPMKEHLRYFPVLNDKNKLLPYFITVRNGNEDYIETVIKGNEKVLGARLEDAKFFYMDDIKEPLETYVEDLKGIVFQEKLGTLYDKTMRVGKLANKIGESLEVGEETESNIERAAYLSKADLVTKVVTEFTELQGKMGMEYAKISKEKEIVSLAILEQYLPRFAGDKLPTTTAGTVLSMADKFDTIAGLFAIGIHPTGSQDPFGLRRQALGIINIILEKKLNLSIDETISTALYMYVDINRLAFDYEKVKGEIIDFFKGRIESMFISMGIRYDVVDALIDADVKDIYDTKIKADELNKWLEEELSEVLISFKRIANLVEKTSSQEVNKDLLVNEELNLYESHRDVEEKIDKLIEKKDYYEALEELSTLQEPIDDYFDNVMVMVEDEKIKNNRLGLLRKIYDTMLKICDLSKIVNK
ncbi:MAG TPA: glycine--tRNA ligase subunit beta [Tissierellaceae bacterium]|nr:glycine--tRNA ligase subunit beta [Tissierellaceae bacterium]